MPVEKLIQAVNIWLPCTKYMSFLQDCFGIQVTKLVHGRVSKYAKIISKYGKKWNLKYEIMASTLILSQ